MAKTNPRMLTVGLMLTGINRVDDMIAALTDLRTAMVAAVDDAQPLPADETGAKLAAAAAEVMAVIVAANATNACA